MKKILCSSMMCANFGNLEKEIKELEEAGIDMFHLDVMDGNYVPNFGMGLQDIEYICSQATIPCDVHLMVREPANYVQKFADIGAKIIYIHPESDIHASRTLQTIKDAGAKPGIALNPGTSFESVKELLYLCDYVMIMSVNPGFAGQQYLEFVNEKCKVFCKHKETYNYQVMIDGACSPEVIQRTSPLGVDGFILGTSALFGKKQSYQQLLQGLRKI